MDEKPYKYPYKGREFTVTPRTTASYCYFELSTYGIDTDVSVWPVHTGGYQVVAPWTSQSGFATPGSAIDAACDFVISAKDVVAQQEKSCEEMHSYLSQLDNAGSPAHAGIDRTGISATAPSAGFPCTRGDRPRKDVKPDGKE